MFVKMFLFAILKLRLDFADMRDNDLDNFAQGVIEQLDGNLDFPVTVPPLADIVTLSNEYSTALTKARNGSKADRIDKKLKKIALINALRLLANDLETKGGGSLAKLSRTGFKVFDTTVRVSTPPGIPQGLVLLHGPHSGTVLAICDKVPKVKTYETRYCYGDIGPDTVWIMANSSTSTETLITGLESTKVIWVQKRTFNANGYSEWSDPARIVVI